MRRNGVGRTRRRLAAAIEAAVPAISVQPEDLYAVADRRSRSMARWNGVGYLREHPKVVAILYSFDTMKQCATNGVDFSHDPPNDYEFHAKAGTA